MQTPVPVVQTNLALWLAFATPVCVSILGIIQLYVAKVQGHKLTEIHTLVNHDHGVTLKLASSALRRVADMTKDPADIMAADDALKASQDHDAKQRTVDKANALAVA